MKISVWCLLLWLLACTKGFGQVDNELLLEETRAYQTNVPMKKVIVCMDDRSVWALSAAGEIYYKLKTDADFSRYMPAAGLVVADLTGYSKNEMYLLVKPGQIYLFENNVRRLLAMPGISAINDIAVVNAKRNDTQAGFLGRRDWLAVASRTAVHAIFRDDALKTPVVYRDISNFAVVEPNWKITSSGFKSIDFMFYDQNYVDRCSNARGYQLLHQPANSYYFFMPETAPKFSAKVNCTSMESTFSAALDQGSSGMQYWGTDNGLFLKNSSSCDPNLVFKKLDGIGVNDLEEVFQVRNLYNRRFLLAASDDGLYYVSSTLFQSELKRFPSDPEMETMTILRVDMDAGKTHSIATEVYSSDDQITADTYQVCEKVVWVASDKGIREVAVLPSKFYSEPRYARKFITSSKPIVNDILVCNNMDVKFSFTVPAAERDRYVIQWYRADFDFNNKQELLALRNVSEVAFKEEAYYGYKITDQCDNTVIESGNIHLRQVEGPNITFDPPAEMSICENGSQTFVTEPGYVYRWMKDDVAIDGANRNTYIATEAGTYRVEVKNCMDVFMPSKSVKLIVAAVPRPEITRSSNRTLCFGETVTLSASEIAGATYKWSSGETTREIVVTKSGDYTVALRMGGDCEQPSEPAKVVVNPELKLEQPPEFQVCSIRNQNLKLTAAAGFKFYTWNGMRGTSAFFNVTTAGAYTLEVEDEAGCTASSLYVVEPYCSPVMPPNAFSPNGDGQNDTWTIGALESDPDAVIRVYNRFGMTVFEGTGLNPTWNGRYNGSDVSAGVYYFVVKKRSEAKPLTGSVMVIR
ncbi:MAG: gliding motility-associated C-terminal domain-containing protein [Bacteroidota bacterium]